jgi:hypothetical protein
MINQMSGFADHVCGGLGTFGAKPKIAPIRWRCHCVLLSCVTAYQPCGHCGAERQKCIFYRNKGNRNRDNIDKRQVLEGDEPLRSCRIRVEQLGADRGCTGRHSCHHQRGYAEEAIARIEHGSREHEKVEHPDMNLSAKLSILHAHTLSFMTRDVEIGLQAVNLRLEAGNDALLIINEILLAVMLSDC